MIEPGKELHFLDFNVNSQQVNGTLVFAFYILILFMYCLCVPQLSFLGYQPR